MFTKCRVGGDLLTYFKSKRDKMGRLREKEPLRLSGEPDALEHVLRRLAGTWVREKDQRRRWAWFCRQHLIHLMHCFSEPRLEVEAALPRVVQSTESLFLLGMPRNGLYFVWYEHPQAKSAHTHGALLLSFLSREARPYPADIPARLVQYHDRLASHALNLSDPMDPNRALLVTAAWASWKPNKQPAIRKVIGATHAAYREKELGTHQEFLKLLEQLGFSVLASPGSDGRPQLRVERNHRCRVPLYPNCVTARCGKETVVFRGPICRPGFSRKRWESLRDRRQEACDRLQEHPAEVYGEFADLVKQRIAHQRGRFPQDSASDYLTASLEDFDWLAPPTSARRPRRTDPLDLTDPLIGAPDLYYPFHGGQEDSAWEGDVRGFAPTERPDLEREGVEEDLFWPRRFKLVHRHRSPPGPPSPPVTGPEASLGEPRPGTHPPQDQSAQPTPAFLNPPASADAGEPPAVKAHPPLPAQLVLMYRVAKAGRYRRRRSRRCLQICTDGGSFPGADSPPVPTPEPEPPGTGGDIR
jgi:hypothetical protein